MTSFDMLNLSGERVLVKGTDQFGTTGQTVLDATEWNNVKAQLNHRDAHAEFDEAVEEFFAPLLAAADKLNAPATTDTDSYVVLVEGTEAQAGNDEVRIKLSKDSIVLRLLERGDTDRLIWVNDTIEVLEVLDFGTSEVAVANDEPSTMID